MPCPPICIHPILFPAIAACLSTGERLRSALLVPFQVFTHWLRFTSPWRAASLHSAHVSCPPACLSSCLHQARQDRNLRCFLAGLVYLLAGDTELANANRSGWAGVAGSEGHGAGQGRKALPCPQDAAEEPGSNSHFSPKALSWALQSPQVGSCTLRLDRGQ